MNCYFYVSLNLVTVQSQCFNTNEYGGIALLKFTLKFNHELFLNRLGSDSLSTKEPLK